MTIQAKSAAMVAELLRVLRKSRRLSQRELARQARTSHRHISAIENRVKVPNLATLDRLAFALGVPMWVILRIGEQL
jgi:transcriptional regulator with XRE-family HTH domain